jgi:16S rRNA A1518/A1519 N6-dimethyltransferase RsmA/KsgA/DIM1 with predicted DNA glycosylase/AP lyase activity
LSAEKFEERFWEIVKAGFAHKRKKLSSNLKNTLSCQRASLTELGNKRAEDLSLADWILLSG